MFARFISPQVFFYLYLYLKPLETVGCVVKNAQFPFLWTNVTKLSFEEFNLVFFTVEHSVESTKAALLLNKFPAYHWSVSAIENGLSY